MAHTSKPGAGGGLMVEVKSKFDAEFRRFSVQTHEHETFESFHELLADVHLLKPSDKPHIPFNIFSPPSAAIRGLH